MVRSAASGIDEQESLELRQPAIKLRNTQSPRTYSSYIVAIYISTAQFVYSTKAGQIDYLKKTAKQR